MEEIDKYLEKQIITAEHIRDSFAQDGLQQDWERMNEIVVYLKCMRNELEEDYEWGL